MPIQSITQSITKRPSKSFMTSGVISILLLTTCSFFPLISFEYLHLLYYLAMLVAIVSGLVHIKYLDRIFNIGSPGKFGVCLFFTLLPVISSLLLSAILYYLLKLPFDFLTFQAGFPVPFLVYQAYASFLDIPVGKYKAWHYPYYDQIPKTENIDHSVTTVVNLVLSKEPGTSVQTSFKLDAPVYMQVGVLFFNFINEYNKSHPEKEIIYADEGSRRFDWLFYLKKGPMMKKVFIDPDISVQENGVRKNDVIYAVRHDAEAEESFHPTEDVSKNSIPQ
jgi:hypothetical protein